MRVFYVHSGSDLYGASRCLLRLATRLVSDGHAVAVVLPSQGPLVPALASAGVDVEVMEDLPQLTRSLGRSPMRWAGIFVRTSRVARRLASRIADFKADLVHTNTATVFLASARAARRSGIPHVWHVREFFHEFGALWLAYRAAMLAHADCVVCVSKAVARQFAEPNGGKVVVQNDGFPAAEFERVSPADAAAFRSRFRLGDAPLVGLPGRIKIGRKGQDVFVRAARTLRDRHPTAKFLLIGSPFPGNEQHLDDVLRIARELGIEDRVVYTGDIEAIAGALLALDIVVLASGSPEPFGGVVVEAMALGKPVVGTNLGGTPEQIVDGETGLLVPPNDPEAMAAAIDRLLRDESLRHRMGNNGRQRFLQCFEFEPYYANMLNLYRGLVKR